ncbi:MAG: energy-coupling factor transporter transmembrane protein EcfT [Nitrososphaerota archaeon]|jgi:energy-coupling factor transport system permease protein|nr:energy-coupling factor transporter transmembrane protein EcfT [Nitrososphaerota archaeon]
MAKSVMKAYIYQSRNSWFLRRDPRAKIVASVMLIVASLAIFDFYRSLVMLAIILVISAFAKIINKTLRSALVGIPFSAFIFLTELLARYGLLFSATISMRFFNLVVSSSLFFTTLSPDEIEFITRWLRMPRDISFVVVSTLRFIPLLAMDLSQIVEVQMSRGLDLQTKNPAKWIKNSLPVIIPLIVISVLRSQQMAEAIELRGYGASKRPTQLVEFRFGTADMMLVLAVLLAAIVIIV